MDTTQRSIAFDVQFKEAVNPDSFPKRLTPQKLKKTSAEEISEKLWHAEQRRKVIIIYIIVINVLFWTRFIL